MPMGGAWPQKPSVVLALGFISAGPVSRHIAAYPSRASSRRKAGLFDPPFQNILSGAAASLVGDGSDAAVQLP